MYNRDMNENLVNAIKERISLEYSKEQIRQEIISAGYSELEFETYFSIISQDTPVEADMSTNISTKSINTYLVAAVTSAIILLLVGTLIYLFSNRTNNNETSSVDTTEIGKVAESPAVSEEPDARQTIKTPHGISLTIPEGWQIWEGHSAGFELLNGWSPETSRIIVLSDSKQVEYRNRDFGYVGSIMSTELDDDIFFDANTTQIYLSEFGVTKVDEEIDDERALVKNIKVGNNYSNLMLVRGFSDKYDTLEISVPVNSKISDEGQAIF
jgi:hypothetical protein